MPPGSRRLTDLGSQAIGHSTSLKWAGSFGAALPLAPLPNLGPSLTGP